MRQSSCLVILDQRQQQANKLSASVDFQSLYLRHVPVDRLSKGCGPFLDRSLVLVV